MDGGVWMGDIGERKRREDKWEEKEGKRRRTMTRWYRGERKENERK